MLKFLRVAGIARLPVAFRECSPGNPSSQRSNWSSTWSSRPSSVRFYIHCSQNYGLTVSSPYTLFDPAVNCAWREERLVSETQRRRLVLWYMKDNRSYFRRLLRFSPSISRHVLHRVSQSRSHFCPLYLYRPFALGNSENRTFYYEKMLSCCQSEERINVHNYFCCHFYELELPILHDKKSGI